MLRWFQDETDHPDFIKALDVVRRQAPREGWSREEVTPSGIWETRGRRFKSSRSDQFFSKHSRSVSVSSRFRPLGDWFGFLHED